MTEKAPDPPAPPLPSPFPLSAFLPAEEILAHPGGAGEGSRGHRLLGHSRQGRRVQGFELGSGPLRVSLIAGCHADEPVGPLLLDKLAAWLGELPEDAPQLRLASWWIVPHVNPDGRAANATWQSVTVPTLRPGDRRRAKERGGAAEPTGRGYDLALYLQNVRREAPGDDLEFGFPRGADDEEARPEARAVADFLSRGARVAGPFHLHASLHGMAFAAGPWFLMEGSWEDRTAGMRDRLRRRVGQLGYGLHDVDRGGEKGFRRIDQGFTTRPDSKTMTEHFRARGDEETAALFRPSSMEHVRSLGGDPLTLVSEMPLFLAQDPPPRGDRPTLPTDAEGRERFRGWLAELAAGAGEGEEGRQAIRRRGREAGLHAMDLGDQMRLQLAYVEEALGAVARQAVAPDPR